MEHATFPLPYLSAGFVLSLAVPLVAVVCAKSILTSAIRLVIGGVGSLFVLVALLFNVGGLRSALFESRIELTDDPAAVGGKVVAGGDDSVAGTESSAVAGVVVTTTIPTTAAP